MKLAHRTEQPLPLGALTPTGWLRRQLEIQAAGLTGHLDEIWPDVRDSGWIGGDAEGWERGPYWLDGLVPLAFLLNDDRLKEKAHRWISYIVDHQRDDGWIGPEEQQVQQAAHKRDPWPLFVALKAMTQYVEATGDDRVRNAVAKTVWAIDSELDRNPLATWAQFRWQDLLVTLVWLAEHGEDAERLGRMAHRIHSEGYDWDAHFRAFRFQQPADRWQYDSHVVNNAMGIKAPGLWQYLTGRGTDPFDPITVLDSYHGQATGVFSGDECLAGRHPSRGTELCAVVEYLYSLETLLSVSSDVRLSDKLERIAFNALPATFTSDMWAHQYDQQANQAMCVRSDPPIFGTNGPDANLYGLEPNFGCCTANMHQGFPKLVSHLAMRTDDGGLRLTGFSPCRIVTDHAEIDVDGSYPFSEDVTIRARSSARHDLPIRFPVPQWATGATIGTTAGARVLSAGTLHEETLPAGGSLEVRLHLPMRVHVDYRYNGAASAGRGPLLYALRVDEERSKVRGEEPAADWEMRPKTAWNLALALRPDNPDESFRVAVNERSAGGSPAPATIPFDPAHPPVVLHARGAELPDWGTDRGAATEPPQSPVTPPAAEHEIELVPYGATNLRIAEVPWYRGDGE